ncbi:transposase [bacterium]|nr:transposase [bacterium]
MRDQVYTNGVESFWSILKRAFIGTHHKMSAKYLPLYLNEFTFRFNHNFQDDVYKKVLSNGLSLNGR